MFETQDRVMTPKGPGVVIARRMAAPDYKKVETYGVILDASAAANRYPPYPPLERINLPPDQVTPSVKN